MVVAAGDSYLADPGFADDASEAMPGFGDDAMPMDGDIAALPEDVLADGEATQEPEPFALESLSLTPEQLAAFREHVSAELSPQLEAQFTQERTLWDQQRQSLESKVYAYDRDRRSAADVLAARQRVFGKFFQDMGIEERDLKALEYEVGQEARRLGQGRAQQQAQHQQVQQAQTADQAEYTTTMASVQTAMLDYAKSVGLDPANPKVNTALMDQFETVVDAAEAYRVNPTPQALKAVNTAKAKHKAFVTQLGTQVKRRQAAQPASDAVARQRARGMQNLGRGSGGGSAPPTIQQLIDTVRTETAGQNLSYKDIHAQAAARYYQQQSR